MGWAKSKIEIMATMGSKVGWEIEKKITELGKIIVGITSSSASHQNALMFRSAFMSEAFFLKTSSCPMLFIADKYASSKTEE